MKKQTETAITTTGTIKKCTINPACADLSFDGLQLTQDDYRLVADWIKNHEEITLTIKPANNGLFDSQDK